ncbi:Protein T04F3.4 [Aphelenchoides avenae]|nr:Protein T04F3.4 [Aphelenchus avenae]
MSSTWQQTCLERFHYFSLHDLNKDNLIDGIEVIKALTHSHDGGPASDMSEAQIEQMVDLVFKDIDMNDDVSHLKQHLDHQIDVDTTKWDQTHERFRYFAMHDLNRDNLLDGTEVLKAYTQHSHGTRTTEVMSEAELENLVDMVMKDLDFNNDGFIDYAEYSKNLG